MKKIIVFGILLVVSNVGAMHNITPSFSGSTCKVSDIVANVSNLHAQVNNAKKELLDSTSKLETAKADIESSNDRFIEAKGSEQFERNKLLILLSVLNESEKKEE